MLSRSEYQPLVQCRYRRSQQQQSFIVWWDLDLTCKGSKCTMHVFCFSPLTNLPGSTFLQTSQSGKAQSLHLQNPSHWKKFKQPSHQLSCERPNEDVILTYLHRVWQTYWAPVWVCFRLRFYTMMIGLCIMPLTSISPRHLLDLPETKSSLWAFATARVINYVVAAACKEDMAFGSNWSQ